jgi:hypothetical protein
VLEFDPLLGYPTRIDWVPKPNMQDAGSVCLTRDVRALQ